MIQIGSTFRISGPAIQYGENPSIPMMGVSDEDTECFIAAVQSPTDALLLPGIYHRYIQYSFLPYIRNEKSWEDCWKSFLNTLELYKDE